MSELSVTCPDESATLQVAGKVASLVRNGGLIELIGDVGSGKTAFVKGLARSLGYEGDVTSPSFALKNVYACSITINHFDLYRLEDPGLVKHELEEAIDQDDSLTVIEWAKSIQDILPEKRIMISFSVSDKNSRKLRISLPKRKTL